MEDIKTLDKNNIEDIIALTPMQEGMLFQYISDPDSEIYFEQITFSLSGDISIPLFKRSWKYVTDSNEMLRTVFRWEKLKKPVQIILKNYDIPLIIFDFSSAGTLNKKTLLDKIRRLAKSERADIANEPFRITLCKLEEDKYEMTISYHHILFDGWSTGIILKDFFKSYTQMQDNITPVKHSKNKFKEYVKFLKDKDNQEEESFWKQYMSGFSERTLLQGDSTDNQKPKSSMDRYTYRVPEDLNSHIKAFTKKNEVTTSNLIYFVWGILLQRYCNTRDVIFGTTVSGRDSSINGIEDMVGLFINTIPLRIITNTEIKTIEAIRGLQKDLKNRESFVSTSLNDIKNYTSLNNFESIFNTIVVIDNYPLDKFLFNKNGKIKIDLCSFSEMTNYDLTLQVMVYEDIDICISYNKDVFSGNYMKRLLSHFINLLQSVINQPSVTVSHLQMLSSEEERQIFEEFNNTHKDYPCGRTLHEIFQEKAGEVPEKIALVYGSQSMAYKELNIRSNQLAITLRQNGVETDSIVAIIADRSFDMVVAIYGILKAGGAYLPIDPNYPEDRIKYMLEDSGAEIILSQGSYVKKVVHDGVTLNLSDESIYTGDGKNLEHLGGSDSLAYVIYTSGSTGKPKGVMISHRSAVNMMFALQNCYPVLEQDAYLLKTTYTFDVSVSEIFGWFLGKGKLVILEKDGEKNPSIILETIREHNVSHINFVPSLMTTILNTIDEEGARILSGLKYVILAGEALPKEVVKKYFEATKADRLENLYGPTEATIYATNYTLYNSANTVSVPIGKPMQNYKAYIVDAQNNLQPVGVTGELCLAGDGLSRGYINNKKLTDEKFISDPFEANKKIYKTGDAARWLEDGNIEFLGRIDNQVKIRGYRIELGEIENVLLKHEMVNEAAVTVNGELSNKYLCAYIVCRGSIKDNDLRAFMLRDLPEYMVPSVFVRLDNLLYTWNGKVDRKALSKIQASSGTDTDITVPTNEVQQKIFEIWKDTLGRQDFGINENFFEKGGNSLLLVQVHKKLQDIFGTGLAVTDLFQYPTISSLSKYQSQEAGRKNKKEQPDVLPAKVASLKKEQADIAIIGMSGRFPKADNIDELWTNLQKGVNAISFFTDEELEQADSDRSYIDDPRYVKAGGIIGEIELFDAPFFGYSPREAETMDPQQRIFLESAYHALEDAACNPEEYNGQIGVFAGSSMSTYLMMGYSNEQLMSSNERFQLMIGNDKDFLSTHVSYKLGLKGPGITVQTACSTSLVAIHMACMSLINGESDIALAGGVSLKVPQKKGYIYSEGGIFSPDGYCRAFDADARGTVGGNGVAVVVLKKLEEAVRDGDNIYAIIKGTAINNDGEAKVGYTAPSISGQMDVIIKALKRSGVNPETIGYVEAHGTGTELGDPIEVAALSKAYANFTDKKRYCAIGSIKPNIGHLDAAAGVTGLIKAALCLKHKKLVPSINFKKANSQIDFENSPFYVNTVLRDWESSGIPRRVAVSSFGIGGTNAHAVLEEYESNTLTVKDAGRHLLLLSAKTSSALEAQTSNLYRYLMVNPKADLENVEFTLKVGRKEHEYRRTLICSGVEDVVNTIENKYIEKYKTYHVYETGRPVVLMFTGQGSQYINMAKKLYDDEPVFKCSFDICCDILKPHIGIDLRKIIYPGNGEYEKPVQTINQTWASQPAVFAIEYAMAKQWIHWGIKPWALIGHSIGEYAAACISGVFSLEDAIALVAARGRLMQGMPGGSMMAVGLSESKVKDYQGNLSIAAINLPDVCVLSGLNNEIDELEKVLEEQNIFHTRLKTSHAFHSKMMYPIMDEFEGLFSKIKIDKPQIPYVSCTTGTWIKDEEATSPKYWVKHLLETVRFSDGINELQKRAGCVFLEVGPGKTLASIVGQHRSKADSTVLYSIAHPKEHEFENEVYMNILGQLWGIGVKIDWRTMYEGKSNRRVPLPGYPFERKYYWIQQLKDFKAGEKVEVRYSEESCKRTVEGADVHERVKVSESGHMHFYDRPLIKNQYIEPSNASEKIIAGIWEEFLGIRPIGMEDDFFELGGHSLMATQIISRIRKIYKVELPVKVIFNNPTVREMVNSLYTIWQDSNVVEEISALYQEIESGV